MNPTKIPSNTREGEVKRGDNFFPLQISSRNQENEEKIDLDLIESDRYVVEYRGRRREGEENLSFFSYSQGQVKEWNSMNFVTN